MSHFLIPPTQKVGDLVTLSDEESHHLSAVLRNQVGDEIRLTDGEGFLFRGVIKTLSKKAATVLLQEKLAVPQPVCPVTFAPALLKGEKMEFVLQKAVELGVETFAPFISSRTVVAWEKGEKESAKISRWRKIAEAASKQCGRAVHMKVQEPVSFETLVTQTKTDVKIIFWEEAKKPFQSFARTGAIHSEAVPLWDGAPTKTITALIGPEGGFSNQEVEFAVQNGFASLSLGPLVLRVDTAAITAINLIQYELGNI